MKARGWIATTIVGAACVTTAAVLVHKAARSADHLDSPATKADSTIDINDVYSWVDGNNVVLAMTLYPAAPSTALFSDGAQYVFHVSSGAAYGATSGDYQIVCTFTGTASPQTTQCWGGTNEYVTGNASTSGITTTDGKMKVFAGLRADPFFFNLDGFHNAVNDVENLNPAPTGTTDAGCPLILATQAAQLRNDLTHGLDGGAPTDFFATFNALAIVVSIDKSLVTTGGPVLAVWASTHK